MFSLDGNEVDDSCVDEQFRWIADNRKLFDEKAYTYSRDFVKSFGLKCNTAGWCTLEQGLSESLLERIFMKAKEENVEIRGEYQWLLNSQYESDWYLLKDMIDIGDSDVIEDEEIKVGKKIYYLDSIKAFKLSPLDSIIEREPFMMFRQSVVNVLQEHKITGLEYMWVQDTGRYDAAQYFYAMPSNFISWCFTDELYRRRKKMEFMSRNITAFGKKASLIWEGCKQIKVRFPLMFSKDTLPEADIAGVFVEKKSFFINTLLVRKKVRDLLINEKLAKESNFEAVFLTERNIESSPLGLCVTELDNYILPKSIKEYYAEQYEAVKKRNRPQMNITKKKVVSLLKKAKKHQLGCLNRGLTSTNEKLLPDNRLLDYYKISNGGWLSDEYYFYTVEELKDAAEIFHLEHKYEANVDFLENSVLFGKCSDGEYILLMADNSVVRYHIGDPNFVMRWSSLEYYMYDAITDNNL